jgi:hypothetical protein
MRAADAPNAALLQARADNFACMPISSSAISSRNKRAAISHFKQTLSCPRERR